MRTDASHPEGDLGGLARSMVETDRLFGLDAVPLDPGSVAPQQAPDRPQENHPANAPTSKTASQVSVQDPPARRANPAATSHPADGPAPHPLPTADIPGPTPSFERIREDYEAHCPLFRSPQGTLRVVFGEGDPEAALAFVGEAPGEQEDRTGRPFVGPAGSCSIA